MLNRRRAADTFCARTPGIGALLGIGTLHSIGTHAGQSFLVMEALEGQTLKRTIGGRPLPTDRLLEIAIQIAGALDEAHDEGVVHRDLGSANIFVSDSGHVSIANISPEQALGREIDARSNVFSFGVILFEMATGSLPFSGPTEAMIVDQVISDDPPSPISLNPRLPTGLVRLIDKVLQKDPAARFASAREIKEQLEEIRRAPGSLDSILPAEHVSSSAGVKLPPRPEEFPEELDVEPALESDPELYVEPALESDPELNFELEPGDGLEDEAGPEPDPPRASEPLPQKFLPLWPPVDDS